MLSRFVRIIRPRCHGASLPATVNSLFYLLFFWLSWLVEFRMKAKSFKQSV
ncbi:hypothetical protein SAMN06264348_1101, partial [Oceanospirillum linum]